MVGPISSLDLENNLVSCYILYILLQKDSKNDFSTAFGKLKMKIIIKSRICKSIPINVCPLDFSLDFLSRFIASSL